MKTSATQQGLYMKTEINPYEFVAIQPTLLYSVQYLLKFLLKPIREKKTFNIFTFYIDLVMI